MNIINADIKNPSIKTRIKGLDELRGIAIIWVMFGHGSGIAGFFPKSYGGIGYHGVVLFFIISGYLITNILISMKENEQPLSVFYIRRIFRLWPLMLVIIFISLLIKPDRIDSLPYFLLFINNFAYANGFADSMLFRTDVMWSLAIEEQFYLLWPLIIFSFKREHLPKILLVVVFIGNLYATKIFPLGGVANKNTLACMQYIAIGCLLGIDKKYFKHIITIYILSYIIFYIVNGNTEAIFKYDWESNVLTLLIIILVYWTLFRKPLISIKPLADIGRLCYGLYLFHFLFTPLILTELNKGPVAWVAWWILSITAAVLSFNYFEVPISNLRVRFEKSRELQYVLTLCIGFTFLISIIQILYQVKN